MTSLVVRVQWGDTKVRICPPIMKQCNWYCNLRNIPGGTHVDGAMATCLVPVASSSKSNITICSCRDTYQVFCLVESKMVIFNPCQVSVALLHYWRRYSYFCVNPRNPAKFTKTREIPRNSLEILPNTCRHNIFESYLGCWVAYLL